MNDNKVLSSDHSGCNQEELAKEVIQAEEILPDLKKKESKEAQQKKRPKSVGRNSVLKMSKTS